MKYTITSAETDARLATVEVTDSRDGSQWSVELPLAAGGEAKHALKGAVIEIANGVLEVRLSEPAGTRATFPIFHDLARGVVLVATALGNVPLIPARGGAHGAAGAGRTGARALKSSMPGKVLKLVCKPGDFVEAGQPLLIIEAMKMENEIRSPQAGVVEDVAVQQGQSVSTGDLLVKIGSGEKK